MKFCNSAVPVCSKEEFDRAVKSGARIEYTCQVGDDYEMPPAHMTRSGGWIQPFHDFFTTGPDERYRAFYPETDE